MSVKIITGDALEQLAALPAESVQCCVTSPPYYGLRCYGIDGQIGLEETPEQHIAKLVEVFREVRRVLRKDGVLWLNYGDAYAGSHTTYDGGQAKWQHGEYPGRQEVGRVLGSGSHKAKDLLMMPARVALALQADGWWLRSMMPWVKRSAMPESVTDRPATAIEYVFLLTKSARYFFDMEAVRTPAKRAGDTPGGNYTDKGTAYQVNGGWAGGEVPAGRNFRNSDLFYASLEPPHGLISAEDPLALDVNPGGFAEAHFATFPPKLVEPLIKAGTSEKGCCPACGAPWVREVETAYRRHEKWFGDKQAARHDRGKAGNSYNEPIGTKTLGWSPSCECNVEPAYPCTVLDPFGGAGTTGLVADRLGRNAILIELNPDYAEMARARLTEDAPLFADVV